MYSIKDFIAYDNSKLDGNTDVLVWSRATGYFFTQASKVTADQKICAVAD